MRRYRIREPRGLRRSHARQLLQFIRHRIRGYLRSQRNDFRGTAVANGSGICADEFCNACYYAFVRFGDVNRTPPKEKENQNLIGVDVDVGASTKIIPYTILYCLL